MFLLSFAFTYGIWQNKKFSFVFECHFIITVVIDLAKGNSHKEKKFMFGNDPNENTFCYIQNRKDQIQWMKMKKKCCRHFSEKKKMKCFLVFFVNLWLFSNVCTSCWNSVKWNGIFVENNFNSYFLWIIIFILQLFHL